MGFNTIEINLVSKKFWKRNVKGQKFVGQKNNPGPKSIWVKKNGF